MSVLSEVFAVPSRVLGVYRYLLDVRGQSESRETLEAILGPGSLPWAPHVTETPEDDTASGALMVRKTVAECVVMGLLEANEGHVRLHPNLPQEARNPAAARARARVTIADLLLSPSGGNCAFALAIAWFLSQDPYNPPGTWALASQALQDQIGGDQLGMRNSNPYQMLGDWACYLGFAWTQGLKRGALLTPDPTEFLQLRLSEVLPGAQRVRYPIHEVTRRLATLCPVFESGSFRDEVEAMWTVRDASTLSRSTALAWFRLRDEGCVELIRESDAPALLLPDGDVSQPVSHVARLTRD